MNKSSIRFAGLVWLLLVLVSCGGGGGSESSAGSPAVNNSSGSDTPADDPEPVSVGSIESVVLVDGSNLSEIVTIENGASLNISELPDTFNFVANPSDEDSTGSVAIEVTGCVDIDRTENVAPYTVQAEGTGFDSDDFAAIDETTCSIDLTPYELDDEQGEEGPTLQMSITVINDGVEDPVDPPSGTPVVELLGDETVYLAQGAEYNELGATAFDAEDGDISDDIVIGGDQVNTLIVATYILSYAVTDSSGATATAFRTVEVQGNQPPEISIVGPATVYLALDQVYNDQGALVSDLEDGDLTGEMTTTSNVDTSTQGEYQVTYNVTDSVGNADTAVRTVIVTSGQASSDINANIVSLTRVDLVSPEVAMFSAEGSTCSDCEDVWGLDTVQADAYSALSYHFNFDDSDSGSFVTGDSRNQQVGPSPRASHAFECSGVSDPNWDSADLRCEFDVAVRVQSIDGDYSDAFIRVNVKPQYGVGGYYADDDIYCVSSTSTFSGCPHSDSSRHLGQVPTPGNDIYNESLILIHNNGDTYNDICTGADERNVRVGTYGTGARPVIPTVTLSGNPGSPCTGSFNNNSTISQVISDHSLEVDSNGHLIDGFGFNTVVSGLKIGEVDMGETHALNGFHDVDMDWGDTGTYSAYFSSVNGADGCIEDSALDCDNLHYPRAFFLSDSILTGNCSNLPGVSWSAYNGGSHVNISILGTEMNRAVEHNIRMMGAYGSIVGYNWLRGNHNGSNCSGAGGGKHRYTLRAASATGVLTDTTKNPEDISSGDHIRGSSDEAEFLNAKNMVISNWINQDGAGQDAQNQSASWLHLFSHWMIVADNTFIADNESDGTVLQVGGSYIVVRTEPSDWPEGYDRAYCTLINGGGYSDGSEYLDSSTIYYEEDIEGPCGSIGNTNFGLPSLQSPGTPGS